jgi:hypothetical protein
VGDGVVLLRDADWDAVPEDLKRRLEDGVERIRRIRHEIAADAKVRQMPPVSVVAAGWSPGEGIVHGLAGFWRNNNSPGDSTLGVILGAGPALCKDDETVRAILVHEFSHCFQIAKILVDHVDLGTSLDALKGKATDQDREERLLANPSDWFAPREVTLLKWHDERTISLSIEVHKLVENGDITGEQPPIPTKPQLCAEPEWVEHIRKIRPK